MYLGAAVLRCSIRVISDPTRVSGLISTARFANGRLASASLPVRGDTFVSSEIPREGGSTISEGRKASEGRSARFTPTKPLSRSSSFLVEGVGVVTVGATETETGTEAGGSAGYK